MTIVNSLLTIYICGSEEKSEEKAANPFSAVSFSSAAKTNPFAAAFTPQTDKTDTKSDDSKNEKSSGFGSFAGGFGSSFGSSGFGSNTKPLFGSSSTTGTLFGKVSTKSSTSVFGSATGFLSKSQNPSTNNNNNSATSSFFSNKSNTYSTPFGASKDANSNDNNSSNPSTNGGGDEKTDKQSNTAEDSSLVLTNGEEGFECIFQTRAKLFKRSPVEEKKSIETGNTSGATQSVPPSTSTSIGSQSVPSSSETKSTEEKVSDKSESDNTTQTTEKEAQTSTKMDWKEVGIGPLRILQSKSVDNVDDKTKNTGDDKTENKENTPEVGMHRLRVVQRRESTPGGTGTKLILNLNLHPACMVNRQADKFVRMSAFEFSDNKTSANAKDDDTKEQQIVPVNYLFRVKTVTEGDELENALKKAIAVCVK